MRLDHLLSREVREIRVARSDLRGVCEEASSAGDSERCGIVNDELQIVNCESCLK